ncbi:tRNA pseudouridine(13) synthase TruD [Candidatus Woesearchaeota archaeon]|nr:tRNA pseudouridine(13) synthase TruD [Candidatus Woesearchaeota archaeon]
MYTIKKYPEDFIVKEVTSLKMKSRGRYAVFTLKKRNYTTLRAVDHIALSLDKSIRDIGFAGIKDKNAVTEQLISIRGASAEDIKKVNLKDIWLSFEGFLDKPISLGDLKGNSFVITIRDFEGNISKEDIMPNLFGEQRFSGSNADIGKLLLKHGFRKAIELILKTDPDCSSRIDKYLNDHKNDFIGALRIMPKKLLKLYAHAYQSLLWNNTLSRYLKKADLSKMSRKDKLSIQIPLIGFTEIDDMVHDSLMIGILKKVMKEEDLTSRSFISRSIPDISLEGDLRDAFAEIKDLKITKKEKSIIQLSFELEKGSYATVAVEHLIT